MTDISTQSQQTLDSLLAKLGAKKVTEAGPKHKTSLGQEDFLKLMTAQMANQDPFAPQSNDQMIAQMAQFSTVTGITQLNNTLSGVASQISENRIATAATFVGKTVLVPGSTALADNSGGISGAIDLPTDATGLVVQITKESGELVKSIDLGANAAGLVGFEWDGRDDRGASVGEARYRVSASMIAGGKQSQASTDVYAPVLEASLPTGGTDQTFKVGGVGTVKMTDIKAIKY